MMLHPNLLALAFASLLIAGMVLYASGCAFRILRFWDLTSGSERQLSLERQTYLVSTVLGYFLLFQLVSLFLFVWCADSISTMFVGAMCAVGTLTVNRFGYPTLLLKLLNFVLAALWLLLNRVDGKGEDYPLLRFKYRWLIGLAPLLVLETGLELSFFLGLTPDIITSCCGSLFSPASRGLATEVINGPPLPVLAVFYAGASLTVAAGGRFYRRGRGAGLFAGLSAVQFVVALVALVSVLSVYIYELPSHHCPFCILQGEYRYIGYPLYLSQLVAVVCGVGVGVLEPFRNKKSLLGVLGPFRRRLTQVSLGAQLVFVAIASVAVIRSGLSL